MRTVRWLAGVAALVGCASPAPPVQAPAPPAVVVVLPPTAVTPALTLLTEADWLLEAGEYEQAARAYGEFLRQFPRDTAAPRVRATQEALVALVTTRAEMARLRAQSEAVERDLAGT